MRILMLLYNPVGRGTYWRGIQLARSLARRDHQVTLLATSQENRLQFQTQADGQPGVTRVEAPDLLWGPLRSGWDPYGVLARIAWSRGAHFELVHAFESRPTVLLPGLYWQRIRGVPLVMDWCDWFGRGGSVEERPNPLIRTVLRPVETFFEERFRGQADGTTVINRTLAQKAAELGADPAKTLLLPNGSDLRGIRPHPLDSSRDLLGLPREVPILGYIGALFHRDARLMASAFDRVRAAVPDTQLLLIGYCNVTIENWVKSPQAVIRTGRVNYNQIGHYLSACDLCWLPMNNSGANQGRTPLKLTDYMAAGRPVVATDVGAAAEIIREGAFGLVTEAQPGPLARGVEALLKDPSQRELLGHRARQVAETAFNWDHLGERLETFYRLVRRHGHEG
jgi:glycosyltransferase involved in cell wall biosynthesis